MKVFFNGRELRDLAPGRSAGAFLLTHAGRGRNLPSDDEPPYLFCGNGSCRDCALHVDGRDDVASCQIRAAPGMSFRTGEGAGEENALSRNLLALERGEDPRALTADLIVVGAGLAGRSAAERARLLGLEPVVLETRSMTEPGVEVALCRPVGASSGRLHVWENGWRRRIDSRAVILATGARDARSGSGREPSISLAKALGCGTVYDRSLRSERLLIDERGATTVAGVFAAGDAVRVSGEAAARDSAFRAAEGAARFLGALADPPSPG